MRNKSLMVASLMASVALPPAGGALAQSMALEEIVVTARKRDESIYEIPVSVSALSQDQLDRAGIDNPEELSDFVAGLDFQGSTATGGRFNPSIRFRGMNQQIITPSTQVGALFWDGSYIGGGGGFLPLGDTERVEVIKGPQTAYFGRNTFSGAVNIIPKRPTDEWEGDITLGYSPSQSDEYKIEGAIGGPISDRVGVRVWAGFERDGGDFRTQADDEPYGVTEDTSFSGTLVYDPTEDWRIELTGYYTRANDTGTAGGVDSALVGTAAGACPIVFTGELLNPATGERTPFTRPIADFGGSNFCGEYPNGKNFVAPFTLNPTAADTFGGQARLDQFFQLGPLSDKYGILRDPGTSFGGHNQTYRYQLKTTYDVGDHTVTFQASRANTGTVDRRDFFFGIPPLGGALGTTIVVGADVALRETYYEARIASPDDQRLRYIVGVSDYSQRYRNTNFSAVDHQDNTTFAIFGSLDYDITDDFTASVELRYTDEESETIIQGAVPQGWTGSGGTCPLTTACNAIDEYDDFIPRVILSYKPFEGATTYASYSYSSLLGVATQAGFINAVAPDVIPADQLDALGLFTPPQENEQFELGWKQQADIYNFTLALFHIDWKNQPFASVIVLPQGGTTSFRGPGDSKYKGFDFEFNVLPADWFQLSGNVAYTDHVMKSFSSRGSNESAVLGSGSRSVVADGNRSRNIPVWEWGLTPTFMGTMGDRDWFFRTDFIYHGKTWADYSAYNRAPDQFLINARFGIDLYEGTSLEIWAKNLTQNKTLPLNGGTTAFISPNRKAFTEPYQRREFGVTLTASF
jgi:iron complex outermembrane receptor protein